MIHFTLPPAFIARRKPQPVISNIQHACGHYERVMLIAEAGMWKEHLRIQRELCSCCREAHMTIAQLAFAPRLRIHCEHGVWAVERLLSSVHGAAFHVVAWLANHEQCEQWIRETFAGRPYEIVDEVVL